MANFHKTFKDAGITFPDISKLEKDDLFFISPKYLVPYLEYVKKNKSVSISNLKQGDIIFFAGEGKSKSVRNVSHVGIYVGDGKFVDARNSKKGVLFGDLTDYWKKRIVVCARPY